MSVAGRGFLQAFATASRLSRKARAMIVMGPDRWVEVFDVMAVLPRQGSLSWMQRRKRRDFGEEP